MELSIRPVCVLIFIVGGFQECLGMAVLLNDVKFTWQEGRDFNCIEDGLFPSATDCCSNMYYRCSNGVASEETCGGNTYFDPGTKMCVRLGQASCGPACEISTAFSTTSRPTPGGFDCPTSNGFFAIPGTCGSDYYACVNGSPYAETCPNNAIFDPVLLICVLPEYATCNAQFKCPANGFFPLPGQCNGFYYICVDDVATLTNCPGTSVFDPELLSCVPNGTASCQTGITSSSTQSTTTSTSTTEETTTSTTTTESTTTTTLAPFSCPATGNYPYPGDCTLYYVCAGGSYIIVHCPAGQVFNPDINFCDSPANVPGCNFDINNYHIYQPFLIPLSSD